MFSVSAKIGILLLKFWQSKITKLLTNVLASLNQLTAKIGHKGRAFGVKFNHFHR